MTFSVVTTPGVFGTISVLSLSMAWSRSFSIMLLLCSWGFVLTPDVSHGTMRMPTLFWPLEFDVGCAQERGEGDGSDVIVETAEAHPW